MQFGGTTRFLGHSRTFWVRVPSRLTPFGCFQSAALVAPLQCLPLLTARVTPALFRRTVQGPSAQASKRLPLLLQSGTIRLLSKCPCAARHFSDAPFFGSGRSCLVNLDFCDASQTRRLIVKGRRIAEVAPTAHQHLGPLRHFATLSFRNVSAVAISSLIHCSPIRRS